MEPDLHALELRRLLQGERHFGHLFYRGDDLYLGDINLAERFEDDPDTPCFVYSETCIRRNVSRLRQALEHAGLQHRIDLFYALKANRFTPLLMVLAQAGVVGLDVASPAEMELALTLGFAPKDISFTSSFLSHADLLEAERHAGVMLNLDSLCALGQLWDFLDPAAMSLGLRLNLGLGAGYRNTSPLFNFAQSTALSSNGHGDHPGVRMHQVVSKLGLHPEQFDEALSTLSDMDVPLSGLHCHLGHNYLSLDDLGDVELAYQRLLPFVKHWLDRRADPHARLSYLNLGGGLGIPLSLLDEPLDLERWSQVLVNLLESDVSLALAPEARVIIEPGNFLVGDAGVLLCRVTAVEPRGGGDLATTVVALDVGYNVHPVHKVHQIPSVLLPMRHRLRQGEPALSNVLVCGNLCEASDVFGFYSWFPPVELGDILVFANAGAYASSVAGVHSARGFTGEFLL